MIAIKNALRAAEGKTSLDGIAIDAALKTTLERMMRSIRSAGGPITTARTAHGSPTCSRWSIVMVRH
jgi:hypothetical protein